MNLLDIYKPIQKDLLSVDMLLTDSLKYSRYKSIAELNNYLLQGKGKRIRPALMILSARLVDEPRMPGSNQQLFKLASAIELIHIASLVHDDIIDESPLRHHRPTFNVRFGEDVSIAFGDYLYAIAFELISSCKNTAVLSCIARASRSLCEGELLQVRERDNLSLLKERYLLIVRKKTASLFAASCKAGAILFLAKSAFQKSVEEYGINLGIAFQIVDDCLDLSGKKDWLGKRPGLDFAAGELTLPVLNLISLSSDKNSIIGLFKNQSDESAFEDLSKRFISSPAFDKTKKDAFLYACRAKKCIGGLEDSPYKHSLYCLVDYVFSKMDE